MKSKTTRSLQKKSTPSNLDLRLKSLLEKDEIDDVAVHDFSLFGKPGVDFLLEAALNKFRLTPYARGNAIVLLGLLKEEKAVETLVRVLQEKEERLRVLAVCALGRVGTHSARLALHVVLGHKNASLAETSCAIDFLGEMGQKEDIKALRAFMKKTDHPPFIAKVQAILQYL